MLQSLLRYRLSKLPLSLISMHVLPNLFNGPLFRAGKGDSGSSAPLTFIIGRTDIVR